MHTAVQLQSPGLTGLIPACPGVMEHFPIAGKGISLSLLSGYWQESLTPVEAAKQYIWMRITEHYLVLKRQAMGMQNSSY